MIHQNIIDSLSLEDKFRFLTGVDVNNTYPLLDAGIESMKCHDGPFGVRMPAKQNAYASKMRSAFPNCSSGEEAVATAFPTGCALGATWNRALVERVGEAIGNEHKAYGVNVMLGPSANIKRHPLCGRNFEYFSEDPLLSGELGASYVEGAQKNGIAACPKHYIANNQERGRFSVSSEMDERTMRELYLAPFERIVKKSKPWSIMCSYNRVNGVHASESAYLMDEILRGEWGFDGVIVSDWGAVKNRAYSLRASIELCMPYQEEACDQLKISYKNKEITDVMIDGAIDRLLTLYDRTHNKLDSGIAFEKHHNIALEAAKEAITLLKNDGILPLDAKKMKRLMVIGETAAKPYIGGDGSSRIKNAPYRSNPLEEIKKIAGEGVEVEFWGEDKINTFDNEIGVMETQMLEHASEADMLLVFASQNFSCYSETMDRGCIELEPYMEHLIRMGHYSGKKVVVVLNIGSAVSTYKWKHYADAILVSWLGGQGMSRAIAETLFGLNNPSGKLAETFPKRLDDVLSLRTYPGDFYKTEYNEKLLVGYRHFDTNRIEPDYEFGYGLSYTNFNYSDLAIKEYAVSFNLKNTGGYAGAETVQLYLEAPENSWLSHPMKELKGFEKVYLQPGEEKRITITLSGQDFRYYNIMLHKWIAERGTYKVLVGGSSRNLPLKGTIKVDEEQLITVVSDLY